MFLLETKCSFWERFAKSNHTRHDSLEANTDTSPPHGGDRPRQDAVLLPALTWFPDAALAAVSKVHHLIFTDS